MDERTFLAEGAEEMQEDLHPSILAFGKESCLMGEKCTLKSTDPGFQSGSDSQWLCKHESINLPERHLKNRNDDPYSIGLMGHIRGT